MIDSISHLIGNLDSTQFDLVHNLASNLDWSNWNFNWFDLDWQTMAQASKPQAQQFNQDVMSDISRGWNNFIKTGQVWALLIGLILGYLFRSVTAS